MLKAYKIDLSRVEDFIFNTRSEDKDAKIIQGYKSLKHLSNTIRMYNETNGSIVLRKEFLNMNNLYKRFFFIVNNDDIDKTFYTTIQELSCDISKLNLELILVVTDNKLQGYFSNYNIEVENI